MILAKPEILRQIRYLLTPGMRICHVVLQECKGAATYDGAWKDQEL